MSICKICKREFKSKKGLAYHLSIAHQMTYKEYFDIYLKTETDGICLICGKETPFARNGYKECCSSKCTCLHRYGVEHNSQIPEVKARMHTPEAHQKVKETNLKKYGVESQFQRAEVREKANIASHSEEAKAKIRKTCLEKYGVDSPLKIEEIHSKGVEASKTKETKDKIKQTCLDRYGVSCGLQTSVAKERARSKDAKLKRVESIKKTNVKRYGVEWPAQNKESFEKQKQTNLERYGVEYVLQSEEAKQKSKQTMLKKYGVEYIAQRQDLLGKIKKKQAKSHTMEVYLHQQLNIEFEVEYYSERYPFYCDLYIPKYDLYIEINNFWTHYRHFFDNTNSEDIEHLAIWKERAKNNNFYKVAIKRWTIDDIRKRDIALKNNLNYVVLWNKEQIDLFAKQINEGKVFVGFNDFNEIETVYN